MAKIEIEWDTDAKTMKCEVNGVEVDAKEVMSYKYDKGFDLSIRLASVEENGIMKHSSLVAYAEEFKTKAHSIVKFLDENHTLAEIEDKKISEKCADWIRDNLK